MIHESNRPAAAATLPNGFQVAVLSAIIVAALYFGRAVFVPLALAVLLSFVLSPMVVYLRMARVPRPAAVGIVVLAAVLAVGTLGMLMARQVTDLANDMPRYEQTLREKLKSLRTGLAQSSIIDRATSTLRELNRELEVRSTTEAPSLGSQPRPEQRPIPVEIHQPPERPLDTYQRVAAALLEPLTTTGLVLILVVFILLQREDIRDRVIRLAGGGDLEQTTAALNDAAFRLSRLLLAQTILNSTFGLAIGVGLWVIGVPSPIVWGIIAGLMRFIPYIGGILAAVFPILLAAAVDPGWSMMLWTLALYLIVEPAVGHFIEPLVLGQTTGLSPLAIVVSVVFWTALWGPIGLLLATPLTICLVVLGRHVEGLAFLGVILGDEPPLSAPETFYQRLLAGSSAEAADQAEKALKTSSLVEYYDTVALAGLRLAAVDAHRGAIDDERMESVLEGVTILTEDLADEPLTPPEKGKKGDDEGVLDGAQEKETLRVLSEGDLAPEWQQDSPPVLIVGARTPLDAAAAEILGQLLQRHGVSTRVGSVTRLSEIGQLDLEGIRLVWLSSLDAAHSQAHIRYLMRRIRRSAPQLKFYGGFWSGGLSDALAEALDVEQQASDLATAVRLTTSLAAGQPVAKKQLERKEKEPAELSMR